MESLSIIIFKELNNKVMKKTSLIILFTLVLSIGFSQKLHKVEGIDSYPLTLNPTIFDPNLDSTITRIEFLQDTTFTIYETDEEAKYSSIDKSEGFEQVWAIGTIGDFRIRENKILVKIRTYHTTGEVKEFYYVEKINKHQFYSEFKWATYGTKGYYYFNPLEREKEKPTFSEKCSI
jgi:hypothetical protein